MQILQLPESFTKNANGQSIWTVYSILLTSPKRVLHLKLPILWGIGSIIWFYSVSFDWKVSNYLSLSQLVKSKRDGSQSWIGQFSANSSSDWLKNILSVSDHNALHWAQQDICNIRCCSELTHFEKNICLWKWFSVEFLKITSNFSLIVTQNEF